MMIGGVDAEGVGALGHVSSKLNRRVHMKFAERGLNKSDEKF